MARSDKLEYRKMHGIAEVHKKEAETQEHMMKGTILTKCKASKRHFLKYMRIRLKVLPIFVDRSLGFEISYHL